MQPVIDVAMNTCDECARIYADGARLWMNISAEATRLTTRQEPPLDTRRLHSAAVDLASDCRRYRAALANATAAYVDAIVTSLHHVTSSADGRIALMAILLLMTLVLCPALCVNYVLAAERTMAVLRQGMTTMAATMGDIDEEKCRTEKLVHKVYIGLFVRPTKRLLLICQRRNTLSLIIIIIILI
ncbi:hypothetical protein NP493_527g06033 [Ridgeia piscesae]|uniref:Uncharacterized protein n=1 Tax=Ridgeia piscesae TaxID=27915 RepID=A0AAD9KWY2_RIDPI|nr:hypothetical protein NP493_527g06033 [Ridgeia piscesae]